MSWTRSGEVGTGLLYPFMYDVACCSVRESMSPTLCRARKLCYIIDKKIRIRKVEWSLGLDFTFASVGSSLLVLVKITLDWRSDPSPQSLLWHWDQSRAPNICILFRLYHFFKKKEINDYMNLNILGRVLVPVAVTSENVVFDGGCCWVWVRGLESKLGSGWFERAQCVAFERLGWNNSRAIVHESEWRDSFGYFAFMWIMFNKSRPSSGCYIL